MKDTRMQHRKNLAPWVLTALALPLAWAQAQEAPDKVVGPAAIPQANDPAKEMEEAFHRVERSLNGMSLLLLEASKGDTSRLASAKGSGIEDLLKLADKRPQGDPSQAISELLYASSAEGKRVLDGIDEILEIAKKNGNPNSCRNPGEGQGQAEQQPNQSQPNQSSQSPSQKQQQSGQKQMKGEEKPDEQAKDPAQTQEPKSNKPQPGDPNQPKTVGQAPPDPDGVGSQQQVLPGREAWGNLPVHVRDIFRADGGADMPARYRRWIDSYYRKLNQESRR